jgi:hypothetical protein
MGSETGDDHNLQEYSHMNMGENLFFILNFFFIIHIIPYDGTLDGNGRV